MPQKPQFKDVMNELLTRSKGIKPSKLFNTAKNAASSGLVCYRTLKSNNQAENDMFAFMGALVGASTSLLQNELPWSFTIECNECIGHFEIRGEQGVALELYYVRQGCHSLKWIQLPNHTEKRKIDIIAVDKLVHECNNHKITVAEISLMSLLVGGLQDNQKLAERVVLGKWNLSNYDNVHTKIHNAANIDAHAYCSKTVWSIINSKYDVSR